MTHPSRSRDRFRLAITSLTALVSAGSLTAVGWFAGTAAREQQAKQAHDDAAWAVARARAARARAVYDAAVARQRSAAFPRRVVLRERPTRTVVKTEYVRAATSPVVVGGGTLTPAAPVAPAPGPARSAPPPVYHAPPPPPPPPAPSTGSSHGG